MPNMLEGLNGGWCGGLDQYRGKKIVGQSCGQIDLAKVLLQDSRHFFENRVALLIPVLGGMLGYPIDTDQPDCQCGAIAMGTNDLTL